MYSAAAAIELVLKNGLRKYKVKNSKVSIQARMNQEPNEARLIDNKKNKKGSVFITRTKEGLSGNGGSRGVVLSSEEAVIDHVGQATHWTPNVFNFGTYVGNTSIIKGHEEKNIQQINCFVVDIDTKKVTVNDINEVAMLTGFGIPTFVLDTPKGYHVYYVLDKPVFVSNKKDYISIKSAKRVSQNMREMFAEHLPSVDLKCNHFGFFRMPTEENLIIYFEENVYTFQELMNWSKRFDDDKSHEVVLLQTPFANRTKVSQPRQIDSNWFNQVIHCQKVMPHMTDAGRNNAIFTLSLACFQSNVSIDKTMDMMDEFNSNLYIPLCHNDVRVIVKSAYSGRYQGANKMYIDLLLETYDLKGNTEGNIVKNVFWRKHKKRREDRVRSHLHEWENDITQFLSKNANGRTIIYYTQKEICEAIGIPRSTLNKVISRSKKVFKKVEGVGKTAITGFATLSMIITGILRQKQEKRIVFYESIKQIFPSVHIELFEEIKELSIGRNKRVYEQIEGLPAG